MEKKVGEEKKTIPQNRVWFWEGEIGGRPAAKAVSRLNFKNVTDIFQKPFSTAIDIQMRWLQLRHFFFYFGSYSQTRFFFKCKLNTTPFCCFCKQDDETIEYVFRHCPVSKDFWDQQRNLLSNQNYSEEVRFCKDIVLFGISRTEGVDKALNFIILLEKLFLFINADSWRPYQQWISLCYF